MEMYSKEQLNNLEKEKIIDITLALYNEVNTLSKQNDNYLELLASINSNRFKKKSESHIADTYGEQLSMFNEIESISDESKSDAKEEESITVPSYTRKKKKGKLDEDLSKFPVETINHEIDEETLKKEFPNGYVKLSDEIYRKLECIPASYIVYEHHLFVYKEKNGDKIIKAKHPKEMLDKSIATPSLVASIINAKYTNAVPLYRIEQEFLRNDINISRQTMSNWVIKLTERYYSLLYDRLKEEVIKSKVIHADETTVTVTKDGKETNHKDFMWVYRTGELCNSNPAIIFEYQKSRKKEHPEEFLKDFKGYLCCDGYQVYHSIEKENKFKVCGCWMHARRFFSDAIKAIGKENAKGTLANEALCKIAAIYHENDYPKTLPHKEIMKRKKEKVKPLVNEFFKWIKENSNMVSAGSKTAKGFEYCLNQEKYLRTFLEDSFLPMDNGAAERSIRPFTIGRNYALNQIMFCGIV